MKKNVVLFLFVLVVAMQLSKPAVTVAQINVSLQQPPPNELKVADLWRVTIVNPTKTTYTVYLQGTAKEATAGLVVDAQTNTFAVPPGLKIVSGRDLPQIKVNSSNSRYKNIMLQTGTVPAGDYTICVTVHDVGGDELGTDCIDQKVENGTLILITPTDESSLDENLPMFIWTSAPPLDTRASYSLKFVEVLGNQSAYAAMQSNSPFFMQADIHTSTLQYPISAPKFIPGRNYAWQVTASEDGATIGQSEVWSFTAKAADSIVEYKNVIKKKFLAQFEAAYGGADLEHGLSVVQTRDTGYIIAGYSRSFGAKTDKAYLIKVDAAGTVQWSKTYGGENDDGFYAVKEVGGGGYVAIGYTRSFDVGNDDIYVVKTAPNGDVEWAKALGGGGIDAGYDIVPLKNGDGYILAGAVGTGDDFDGYVARLDKGGNKVWGTNLGGYDCDVLHGIAISGENYLAAGYTRSMGAGNDDMYVSMFSPERGQLTNSFTYGNARLDRASGIAAINADIADVVGFGANANFSDLADIEILHVTGDGLHAAALELNGGKLEIGLAIHSAMEGGVVIGGYILGDSAHLTGGALALEVNAQNKLVWSRIYTGSLVDQGLGITSTLDGGIAMSGLTDRGSGKFDALLLKTDKMGIVGCTDQDAGMITSEARPIPEKAHSLSDYGMRIRDVRAMTKVQNVATIETMLCPKPAH